MGLCVEKSVEENPAVQGVTAEFSSLAELTANSTVLDTRRQVTEGDYHWCLLAPHSPSFPHENTRVLFRT